MTRVECIQHDIQKLSNGELADFRRWFATFDVESWDQQLELDVLAGKLNQHSKRALRDHAAGKTTRM